MANKQIESLKLGIFRIRFPVPSETFIVSQAQCLLRYKPIFIARNLCRSTNFPVIAPYANNAFNLKRIWYSLSKSPTEFLRHDEVKQLNCLHAHFGPDGVYALEISESLGIPLVTTFHGYDITSNDNFFSRSPYPIYWNYLQGRESLKQKGSLFIAVSDYIRRVLLDAGFPEHKVILNYVGVDINKFFPLPGAAEERYILNVARHVPVKGVNVSLEAFSRIAGRYPDVSLLQVGSGPLSNQLKALTQKLGLCGRVKFLGEQPHDVVLRLMQRAEVFISTSQTTEAGCKEALGIVFNEASACGVPIVSTLHGGIPEAVLHGETGLLAPEGNVEIAADHLSTLLSNREFSRYLGRRGREFVCDCFDLRKQTGKLEALYDEVLS